MLHSTSTNHGYDDERGDYFVRPGDHLAFRYEIMGVLGRGSYGQVVRCRDYKTNKLLAVKIIRNKKRFHRQVRPFKPAFYFRSRFPPSGDGGSQNFGPPQGAR
jgi:serine/threonine protein kinase